MTIPNDALLETDLGDGVVLYDVSHLLKRHPTKKYLKRDAKKIAAIVVHKTGADGPPGFKAAEAMTNFCVDHRGWPGAAYTFILPRVPDEHDGRLVVYRCNRDDVRSYHTGGQMNETGVGIGVQGNYDGEWDLLSSGLPRIAREPTAAQWTMLKRLVDWLAISHGIVVGRTGPDDDWGLTGHWEHGKIICPGDALRLWTQTQRGEAVTMLEPSTPPRLPAPTPGAIDTTKLSALDLQRALKSIGFDPGPLDGLWGYRSRAALEKFQSSESLTADGWYGPKSAEALSTRLRAIGVDTLVDLRQVK